MKSLRPFSFSSVSNTRLQYFKSKNFFITNFYYFLLVFITLDLLSPAIADISEWHGCEGYILDRNKNYISDTSIDFSTVSIKLYTEGKILKQTVNCSPNGFYSLPIDDPRRPYTLSINSPDGWSFTPSFYEITEKCQNNLNFVFNGFSVNGRIVAKNSNFGPKDVRVILKQKDGSVFETSSTENGSFIFENIFPGKITINAFHPTYNFSNQQLKAEVINHSLVLDENFFLDGYPVTIKLINTDDSSNLTNRHLVVAISSKSSTIDWNLNECKVSSGLSEYIKAECPKCIFCSPIDDGHLKFSILPVGVYSLKIFLLGLNSNTYEIQPYNYTFEVNNTSLELNYNFKITHFPLFGYVLAHSQKPINKAKIIIDNKNEILSDSKGYFKLDHIETGYHDFNISAPHINFNSFSKKYLNFKPDQPLNIIASSYDISGTIFKPVEQSWLPDEDATLNLISSDGSTKTIFTNKKGQFNYFCEPGNYTIILSQNSTSELDYFINPKNYNFEIIDSPKLDLNFYKQLFMLKINVISLNDNNNTFKFNITQLLKNNKFSSREVTGSSGSEFNLNPGIYEISIIYKNWCFEKSSFKIQTSDSKNIIVNFVQTGYRLNGNLDNEANIRISHTSDEVTSTQIEIKEKGDFSLCLPTSGIYKIESSNCYDFKNESYFYNTDSNDKVLIEVKNRLYKGIITLNSGIEKNNFFSSYLSLSFLDQNKNVTNTQFSIEFDKEKENFNYNIMLDKDIQNGTIIPLISSQKYKNVLFFPSEVNISNCKLDNLGCCILPTISAKLGTIIDINFDLNISNIEISVKDSSTKELIYNQISSVKNNIISVGPFYTEKKYYLTPKLENYNFTPNGPNSYTCSIVSSISVEFITSSNHTDSSPLNDVSILLTSLIDPSFKERKIIKNSSVTSFKNLIPGTYFLQPFLKEYSFQPPQQTIKINQDENINLKWSAKRVAYSCIGYIKAFPDSNSLDVSKIVIEARSDNDELIDTLVDSDGSYILKGLAPYLNYIITPKYIDNNDQVRISPLNQTILINNNDIRDVNFGIIFSSLKLTGSLIKEDKFFSYTLELYQTDNNQLIKTKNIFMQSYFEFTNLLSKKYTLVTLSGINNNNIKNKEKLKIISKDHIDLTDKNSMHLEIIINKPNQQTFEDNGPIKQKTNPLISLFALTFIFYFYLKSIDIYNFYWFQLITKYIIFPWKKKNKLSNKKMKVKKSDNGNIKATPFLYNSF